MLSNSTSHLLSPMGCGQSPPSFHPDGEVEANTVLWTNSYRPQAKMCLQLQILSLPCFQRLGYPRFHSSGVGGPSESSFCIVLVVMLVWWVGGGHLPGAPLAVHSLPSSAGPGRK